MPNKNSVVYINMKIPLWSSLLLLNRKWNAYCADGSKKLLLAHRHTLTKGLIICITFSFRPLVRWMAVVNEKPYFKTSFLIQKRMLIILETLTNVKTIFQEYPAPVLHIEQIPFHVLNSIYYNISFIHIRSSATYKS